MTSPIPRRAHTHCPTIYSRRRLTSSPATQAHPRAPCACSVYKCVCVFVRMRTHLLDTCVCFPAVRVCTSNRERARSFEDHVHVCLLDTRPHIYRFQNRKSLRRAQPAQTLSQALEAKPYSHTAMSRADAGTHQLLQLLGRWRDVAAVHFGLQFVHLLDFLLEIPVVHP